MILMTYTEQEYELELAKTARLICNRLDHIENSHPDLAYSLKFQLSLLLKDHLLDLNAMSETEMIELHKKMR